ncbi:tryptophan synthase subunit alpha [Eikenella sp. S3360]|uniref:Tryptophan synthase alpha chain n=1 Tax=Eikenella glucosivorans TaxID=2766967 RepID=A0ABS0NC39_9NEIS|nr:tryptophan synthase subunit alpha [Eikenella glucosivorans]MBH5329846.1 tryptophan synthase subunit alpha [Eikenella glucosivorans]
MKRIFQHPQGRKALVTYITAGDPSLETTLELMHSLAANGADIIELGVPFSDPMADGPTIQRAAERALAQGVTLADVLDTVRRFRQSNQNTPVVLMGYLNPIHKMGYAEFARAAAQAGVDGVLTVDSPIETIAPLHEALKAEHIDTIFLIAPTTGEARMAKIAKLASGFVYYVSLKGVTGSASLNTAEVADKVAVLRRHVPIPICVGFGISDAESARQIATVADGVVIGSRIVKEIEANPGRESEAVGRLVRSLKDAI